MNRKDYCGLGKFRATGLHWYPGSQTYFRAGALLYLRAVTLNNYDQFAVSIHYHKHSPQIAWLANNSERARSVKQMIHHMLLQGVEIIATPIALRQPVVYERGLVLWMKR